MLRFVRRQFDAVLLILAVCFGATLLLPLLLRRPLGGFLPFSLAVLALMVLWAVLYAFVHRNGLKNALAALADGCDPEPLLEVSLDALGQYRKKGDRSLRLVLNARLNASTALHQLGRDGEALEQLDATAPFLPKKPDIYHVVYWLNRAAVFHGLGRGADMAHCLDQARTALAAPGLQPAQAERYGPLLQVNDLAHRLLTEGPGPEVEAEYERLLAQAQNESQRVGFHLSLGKCALARGDRSAARTHLEYAAAHGNRLFCRQEAETLLLECAAHES